MLNKIFPILLLMMGFINNAITQPANDQIDTKEVERIEKILASDNMQGRAIFTPAIDLAADFISSEFRKAGLQPLKGDAFFQEFHMQRTKFRSASIKLNGAPLSPDNVLAYSSRTSLVVTNDSGFKRLRIGAADKFYNKANEALAANSNYIVFVDSIHSAMLHNLRKYMREFMPSDHSVIFIVTNTDPATYSVEYDQEIIPLSLKNVVGIIPGTSRKEEYVVFSAHYDHLGIRDANPAGDSIYNGANDDASGVTAVILLADYFHKKKNNERTLIFVAFTGEESGGYGSKYFSEQLDANKVTAMFNIEMIGTESKWGNNSAFITGYDKSDMGAILTKNLEGSSFKFYADPYPEQDLFYRSDNATLARLGVPAHTISTSKMDSEKFYHTQEDEVETLDIGNMSAIIRAIALSSRSIVAGQDTPSRVDASKIRK